LKDDSIWREIWTWIALFCVSLFVVGVPHGVPNQNPVNQLKKHRKNSFDPIKTKSVTEGFWWNLLCAHLCSHSPRCGFLWRLSACINLFPAMVASIGNNPPALLSTLSVINVVALDLNWILNWIRRRRRSRMATKP